MPTIEASNDESLILLTEFLDQIKEILEAIISNPGPLIPDRHHEQMKEAWSQVQIKFDVAKSSLSPGQASDIMTQLIDAGLTGHQLVFKLSIFRQAREELIDHGLPRENEPEEPGWWDRLKRLVKPTLKAANVILGSLAKVLLVIDPIKEFKEGVEAGVELGEAGAELGAVIA